MEQTGTLYISIPINDGYRGKLVTVTRVAGLTEDQAKDHFAEWKRDNPQYHACAKWKTERVAFF